MLAVEDGKRYAKLHRIGEGSFGQVFRATDTRTGRDVALKHIRLRDLRSLPAAALREVLALGAVEHPNVMRLVATYTHGANLVLVLPLMRLSLHAVLDQRATPLPERAVRDIGAQLLAGLAATHEAGVMHRDVKPGNVLFGGDGMVQLADFGQARLRPDGCGDGAPLTAHVGTRWYRAPELLLGSTSYGAPVDMWAAGCVLAQLYTLSPLLAGASDIDQMFRVVALLGSPTSQRWPAATSLPDHGKLQLPECEPTPLGTLMPHAPDEALTLLDRLLRYEPRATATEAFGSEWVARRERLSRAELLRLVVDEAEAEAEGRRVG